MKRNLRLLANDTSAFLPTFGMRRGALCGAAASQPPPPTRLNCGTVSGAGSATGAMLRCGTATSGLPKPRTSTWLFSWKDTLSCGQGQTQVRGGGVQGG